MSDDVVNVIFTFIAKFLKLVESVHFIIIIIFFKLLAWLHIILFLYYILLYSHKINKCTIVIYIYIYFAYKVINLKKCISKYNLCYNIYYIYSNININSTLSLQQ